MGNILAVVVTYNRLELLKKCTECIKAQKQPCDLLIVNNASTDGTEEYLATITSDNVFAVNTGANLGGAGGFAAGMKYAAEHGYEYAWIMDDDCLPGEDTLALLKEADEFLGGPEKYGYLASNIIWTDGNECVMNRSKKVPKLPVPEGADELKLIRVLQSTFVSLLIPTAHIKKYGLPLAPYFIWNDDIEFTRRLAVRGGLPSYEVGASKALHAMTSNVGSNIGRDDIAKIDRYRMAFRNEACTYSKEGLYGFALYWYRCLRSFVYICFQARDNRGKRFAALFKGIGQGFTFRPEPEYPEIKDV